MELGTYSETAYELIPAYTYTVELTNIEVTDKLAQYVEDGQDDKQWKWRFTITGGGEQDGVIFYAWSNRTINKGSTAKPWVEALLGRKLVEGESLNAEDILNKTMKIYLGQHETKTGKTVNRIKDILSGPSPTIPPQFLPGLDGATPNKEALGYPRRYLAARRKLEDLKVSNEVMSRMQESIAQSETKFPALPVNTQKEVLEHFEDWAANPDSYDAEGGFKF